MIDFNFSEIINLYLIKAILICLLFIAPALVVMLIGIFIPSRRVKHVLLFLSFCAGAFLVLNYGFPGLISG